MKCKHVFFYIIFMLFVIYEQSVFAMVPEEYQYKQELSCSLFRACKKGNLNDVIDLIEQGVNVNTENKENLSPLHVACKRGYIDIVKFLIANKANINSQTRDLLTPLHYAVREGQGAIVDYLLNVGVDICIQTIIGQTALDIAYERNYARSHEAIIELFLNHNAG